MRADPAEPLGNPFFDATSTLWVEICPACGAEATGITERAVRGFSGTVHLPPPADLQLRFEHDETSGLKIAHPYAIRADGSTWVVGARARGKYSRVGSPHPTFCAAVLAANAHAGHERDHAA